MTELIPYFIHIDGYDTGECPFWDCDDVACIKASESSIESATYRCQGCITEETK